MRIVGWSLRGSVGLLLGNVQNTLGMHVNLRKTCCKASIQTWHRYPYVANNPPSNVDLLGLRLDIGMDPNWFLSASHLVSHSNEGFVLGKVQVIAAT